MSTSHAAGKANPPHRISMLCLLSLATVSLSAQAAPAADPTPDQVSRGEYLARAGDCIACHTRPGGEPFAGGLGVDTPFGTVYTPNITPDKQTGIGNWTLTDFQRAMHEGLDPRGLPYNPVFPYTFFTKVTDADVAAIWAYLRTVPPVSYREPPTGLHWPYRYRPLMFGWQALFFTKGTYQPRTDKSEEWNRGAYLVEGLGHCGACHTPRNALGGTRDRQGLSGAEVDHWLAPNITGDLRDGVGKLSVAQLVAFMKTGSATPKIAGQGAATEAMGPMGEVIHDSLSHLSDSDLKAMAVYLKDSKAPEPRDRHVVPTRAPAPAEQQGQQVYEQHCLSCHQATGTGIANVFPALAGNPVLSLADPADVVLTILKGAPDEPEDALNPNTSMPAFASQLDDGAIAAVATWVRTQWGNTGGPVTVEQVWKLRQAK